MKHLLRLGLCLAFLVLMTFSVASATDAMDESQPAATSTTVAENQPAAEAGAPTPASVFTIPGSELAKYRITDPTALQRYTSEAATNFSAALGRRIDPNSLVAYNFGTFGVLQEPYVMVEPRNTPSTSITVTTLSDGSVRVAGTTSFSALRNATAEESATVLPAGPFNVYLPLMQVDLPTKDVWVEQRQLSNCRTDNPSYGTYQVCWNIYKLDNDNDPNRDYWGIKMVGTAQPDPDDFIWGASVGSVINPLSGTADTIVSPSRAPDENIERNCTTVNFIAVGGGQNFQVGLEVPLKVCEKWTVNYDLNPPWNYKVTWTTPPPWIWNDSRKVGYVRTLWTAEGQNFSWGLGWDFSGHNRQTGR
jgi:hypothetical protein